MGTQAKKLLIIDDDMIDAHFVVRAFSAVGRNIEITHATDADGATSALSDAMFDYVLLDINLPGTDGLEMLKRIRANERTAILPVIMLSSSMNPSDIYKCYAGGANAYTVKPSSLQGYRDFAEGFARFWLDQSIGPRSGDGAGFSR